MSLEELKKDPKAPSGVRFVTNRPLHKDEIEYGLKLAKKIS